MNLPRFIKKLSNSVNRINELYEIEQKRFECQKQNDLLRIMHDVSAKMPDCPILYGKSIFSQNDEDGIIEHIFRKINCQTPNFIEFGVSPLENNTNYLLLKGSRGCWIDKGLQTFINSAPANKKLLAMDDFVTVENIVSLVNNACGFLGISQQDIDLLSLDLDGNDFYLVNELLEKNIFPKVFCLEYNALFPPDLDIKIRYNKSFSWKGDNYYGCSLKSYESLLSPRYTLVSCNIPGSNCFFVRNDLADAFTRYSIEDLYQPARYYHSPFPKGHQLESKFILDVLAG